MFNFGLLKNEFFNTKIDNHMINKVDFGIVVALYEELEGILDVFGSYKTIRINNSNRLFYQCFIPSDNGVNNVIITLLNGMGNIESTIATDELIRCWNPTKILILGLAGGTIPEEQKLGDVIIGESIFYYELQKILDKQINVRPQQLKSDRMLYQHALNLPQLAHNILPKTHFGVIASGEKVIANSNMIDYLKIYQSKIISVEMESWGVALSAFSSINQTGFLTIRGISDFADKNKSDFIDKENVRIKAIKNAAIWAYEFIKSNPLNISQKRDFQFVDIVNIPEKTYDRINFFNDLSKRLDRDDFHIFCSIYLNITIDNLIGETTKAKIASLINLFERKGQNEMLKVLWNSFQKNEN